MKSNEEQTECVNKELKVLKINTLEITNFKLSVFSGLYWLEHDEHSYPVFFSPYDIIKMFETEGIPISESLLSQDCEELSFSKCTLLRSNHFVLRGILNEDWKDITPQKCWVKDNA